jgi:hypothetical protein
MGNLNNFIKYMLVVCFVEPLLLSLGL